MKINLYKSEIPDHLLLRVENYDYEVSNALKIFLSLLSAVRTESVVIEGENMVRFATIELTPDQLKNLKLSIISSVRGLCELDTTQALAAYLLEKQRSESSILMTGEIEKSNLALITQNEIFKQYIKHMHTILGWMTLTAAAAILVSIVAIISRWLL